MAYTVNRRASGGYSSDTTSSTTQKRESTEAGGGGYPTGIVRQTDDYSPFETSEDGDHSHDYIDVTPAGEDRQSTSREGDHRHVIPSFEYEVEILDHDHTFTIPAHHHDVIFPNHKHQFTVESHTHNMQHYHPHTFIGADATEYINADSIVPSFLKTAPNNTLQRFIEVFTSIYLISSKMTVQKAV